ncbi:MAG: hypothetical protein HFF11_10120 [Angelakisella sp.]|jgi:hypothetical protein|nr:hypothetical protein [Angelakisella sp.]
MNKRRIPAAALALVMAVVTAYGAEDAPYNPGPVLDEITLSAQTAAPGGTLSVGAEAGDSDGVRSIWVRFIHDETGTVLSVPLKARFGDPQAQGYYSGELDLPPDAPLGEYALRSVVLVDQRDGRTRYLREADMNWNARDTELLEEELSFTLVRDTAGPVLLGCSVLQETVQAGEDESGKVRTARITLTAADDGAGFQKAALVFQEPGGKKLFAALDRNDWSYDDVYQVDLPVKEHQTKGSYRLVKATLEDRAGNRTILGYGKDAQPLDPRFSCAFTVLSEEDDRRLAPVLQTVQVVQQCRYDSSTEIELAVQAVPRGSALHHITVRFKNDANGNTLSKVIRAEDQDFRLGANVYTGWLTVDDWEPEGTFTLDSVVLTDEAGNSQSWCRPADRIGSKLPLPCTASFTARTGSHTQDTQAPVVTALEMAPDTSVGVNIPLRVKAADDRSGVDTIRARFENDEGRVIVISLYEKEDGWFSGNVPGAKLTHWDQFRLTRLVVTDGAGNRRTYLAEPGSRGQALPREIQFTVNDNED